MGFKTASQRAKIGSKGGSNIIFNEERALSVIKNAPNHFISKIFFYIALNQPQDGIRGFEVNKKQLQYDLQLGRTVFFDSLHWLKAEMMIHELKQVETVDFMVNPLFVMNNCDFQTRMEEWKRRQRLDIQREIRLKEKKRLRELKNASKT